MSRTEIEVRQGGAQSQLQDLGRHGHQHLGVPVGGAMDTDAHQRANRLVGHRSDEATLEMVLVGPSLWFSSAARIAITGADLSPTLAGQAVPLNVAVNLPAGAVLAFGARVAGMRSYLAVQGGFDVPRVMGSRSTYIRGGFGGHQGRALRRGDRLAIGRAPAAAELPTLAPAPHLPQPGPDALHRLRVVWGEHWALFTEAAQQLLCTATFRISHQSDRMGYRLTGPALARPAAGELISEAVTFGTVQVPPDGQPIVLMAERQSTGGYPKIGHVISADLPLLAQLGPDQALRFEPVALAAAQALDLARVHHFEAAVARAT